jgi:opacity protein-like surface antigen
MSAYRQSILAGVLAVMATPAMAADMSALDLPPVAPPIATPVIEEFSGWYLRGDADVTIFGGGEARQTGWNAGEAFRDEEWKPGYSAGLGVGYEANRHVRGDVTVNYHDLQWNGTAACPDLSCIGATRGHAKHEAEASLWTVLANGYIDVGRYYGLTPYVGAGIGAAHVDLDYTGESWDGTQFVSQRLEGTSSWSLAGALHAGFSYDFAEFLKVDTGYSFLWLGGFETDEAFEQQVEWDDLHAHSIRVGLRYVIN